MDGVHLIVS